MAAVGVGGGPCCTRDFRRLQPRRRAVAGDAVGDWHRILFEENPFERCVRRPGNDRTSPWPANYLLAGRVALGLEPVNDRF
jgi:hypothetical protein